MTELGFEPRQSSSRDHILNHYINSLIVGSGILASGMKCFANQSSPGPVWDRPGRQEHGEEAGQRVGHGAEGDSEMVGDRSVGQAGVGLHRGQHAVGEHVHKGHQDVGEDQVGRVMAGCFLLQMSLALTAVHGAWGAQVLFQ